MSIIQVVPVLAANQTLPRVARTDFDYYTDNDPTAYEHWIFDKGNSGNLTGRNRAKVLTPQSASPTHSSNYLSQTNSNGNALLTDLPDVLAATRTAIVVFRAPTLVANRQLFGSYDSTGPSGGLLILNNAAVNATYKNIFTSVVNGSTIVAGNWYFAAASIDMSVSPKRLITSIGGQSTTTTDTSGTYVPSAFTVGLGNTGFSAANTNALDFAEFAVYDVALTAADLATCYTHSKARMLARGITVQ
jgi:hypothetical protein